MFESIKGRSRRKLKIGAAAAVVVVAAGGAIFASQAGAAPAPTSANVMLLVPKDVKCAYAFELHGTSSVVASKDNKITREPEVQHQSSVRTASPVLDYSTRWYKAAAWNGMSMQTLLKDSTVVVLVARNGQCLSDEQWRDTVRRVDSAMRKNDPEHDPWTKQIPHGLQATMAWVGPHGGDYSNGNYWLNFDKAARFYNWTT
jgi:hypothetical protein